MVVVEKRQERKKRGRELKRKERKMKNERRREKYSILPLFNFQREMKEYFFLMSVPHKIKSPNLVRIGYRAPVLYHPIKNCYISFFT